MSTFRAVFNKEDPQFLICAPNLTNCVYLRQTRRLRRSVWWPRLFNLFVRVAFADLCDVGFRLARASAFAMRLMLLFVPAIRRFVAVFSTVSALTIESRVFNFRISVTLSRMILFAFLVTFLPLARFALAFPYRDRTSTSIGSSS